MLKPRSNLSTKVASLDGLRGVAVLLVVLSHMSGAGVHVHPSLNLAGAGKLGVYLFFVLSAFLLTYQYFLSPPEAGRAVRYWAGYAARRFLRIYPLFCVALAAGTFHAFVGKAIFGPGEVSVVRHLALLDGVKILWAIPVEMKFYLVLPFLLVFLDRVLSRRTLTCVVFLFVSVAFKEWMWRVGALGGLSIGLLRYVSTFLYGVMGAVIFTALRREAVEDPREVAPGGKALPLLLDLTALVCFLAVMATIPGLYRLLVDAAGAMPRFHLRIAWYGFAWMLCVLAAVTPGTWTGRILEARPLRWCGLVSFSVYLVHMPVIDWGRRALHHYSDPGQVAAILAITLMISTCTYFTIERPFMQLGSWFSRRLKGDSPSMV